MTLDLFEAIESQGQVNDLSWPICNFVGMLGVSLGPESDSKVHLGHRGIVFTELHGTVNFPRP